MKVIRANLLALTIIGMIGNRSFGQLLAQKPVTVPGAFPAKRQLNMNQAMQLGLANSLPLRIAAEAVIKARSRVSEQKLGFNPTIGATGTLTHLDEGSSFQFADANGDPISVTIVKQDQKQVNLNAQLPLDIMGLTRTAVQQAQFLELATRIDFQRSVNITIAEVRSAYYDVQRAHAFVKVNVNTVANANDRLKTAEANLKFGVGTKFDVLRAETDKATAEQNLIQANNRVRLSEAALNFAMGTDQKTPLELAEEPLAPTTLPSYDSLITEAYKSHPELLSADMSIRAAEKGIKLAARTSSPSLGVGFQFQYLPDAGGFAPKTSTWAAVATLQLPIFDQGLSRERVRQARIDVDTAKLQRLNTQSSVALEVRQALTSLEEAKERLVVNSRAVEQAKEGYRLAKVRFDNGVTAVPGGSPIVEISDAQTALTAAETNLVNSQYDVLTATTRVDKSLGRYAWMASVNAGKVVATQGAKK